MSVAEADNLLMHAYLRANGPRGLGAAASGNEKGGPGLGTKIVPTEGKNLGLSRQERLQLSCSGWLWPAGQVIWEMSVPIMGPPSGAWPCDVRAQLIGDTETPTGQ